LVTPALYLMYVCLDIKGKKDLYFFPLVDFSKHAGSAQSPPPRRSTPALAQRTGGHLLPLFPHRRAK
jgi:hypothetical protein